MPIVPARPVPKMVAITSRILVLATQAPSQKARP
jgi:hypothetical protein